MESLSRIGESYQFSPQNEEKKLKRACRDFEAIFTYQLLKSMRRTVEKCDLFHGGQAEEIYESLLDMELAKKMSDLGPGSLSRLLYNQFTGHLGGKHVKDSENRGK
ncbi:MAG: muramidase [Deltaproteobacteria bacterium]|nr:MAG: muramidase [Deltaproteobacteria bacterium]